MKIHYKWRSLAGQIICKWAIFQFAMLNNQRVYIHYVTFCEGWISADLYGMGRNHDEGNYVSRTILEFMHINHQWTMIFHKFSIAMWFVFHQKTPNCRSSFHGLAAPCGAQPPVRWNTAGRRSKLAMSLDHFFRDGRWDLWRHIVFFLSLSIDYIRLYKII